MELYKFDLLAFRKERKLTQKDIARQIGVSRSWIANIEAGNDVVSDNVLIKIESAFKVDLSKHKSYYVEQPKNVAIETHEGLIEILKTQTEALAKCNEEKEALYKKIIELQEIHDIEIKSPSSAPYILNEPLSKQSKLTSKTKTK